MSVRGTPARSAQRSRHRSIVVTLVLALAFLAGSIGQAQAHYVKSSHWTYKSSDVCTYQSVEVSHGDDGNGYTLSSVDVFGKNWTIPPPFANDCLFPNWYPPGYITQEVHGDVWDGKAWQLCAWWSWMYNQKLAMSVSLTYHHLTLICGSAYYRTYSGGYVCFNSAWKGGWHASGWHWLPDNSKGIAMEGTAARPAPPPENGPLAPDYPKTKAPGDGPATVSVLKAQQVPVSGGRRGGDVPLAARRLRARQAVGH